MVLGIVVGIGIVGCNRAVRAPPPPPAPAAAAKIAAAKNVFVSNLGGNYVVGLNVPGGINGPYNTFYASLQRWGHFQLVGSPKQADLIFEIYTTEKPAVVDKTGFGTRPSAYSVTGSDSVLWATKGNFDFPAGNGGKAWEKTFNQSIEALTDQIRALVPAGGP
jgi:hypothetical protein